LIDDISGSEDHGIEAIGRGISLSPALETIDLRNNRIMPQSAVVLAESFKVSHALSRIDLRWNMLGNAGSKAILDAVRSNSRLSDIQITGNNVSYEIQMELTRMLERNKSLHGIDEREKVLHRAMRRDFDGMRVVKEEEILALQGKMMAKETIAGQYQKKLE
jgi:Ran GTPase-activating protein (RanGAP) involved in mRNA processing and transport